MGSDGLIVHTAEFAVCVEWRLFYRQLLGVYQCSDHDIMMQSCARRLFCLLCKVRCAFVIWYSIFGTEIENPQFSGLNRSAMSMGYKNTNFCRVKQPQSKVTCTVTRTFKLVLTSGLVMAMPTASCAWCSKLPPCTSYSIPTDQWQQVELRASLV